MYAPTAVCGEETLEAFYEDIDKALSTIKNYEFLIVMGDFNAKIGRGRTDNIAGPHGLGDRNERGDRLIEFCAQHELVIANTWFQQPPRRLYTWRAPGRDGNGNPVKNQIDYILIRQRFRNSVRQCRTFPGADCGSDHVPLLSSINLTLRRPRKLNARTPKWNVEDLHSRNTALAFKSTMKTGFAALNKVDFLAGEPEEQWDTIRDIILESAEAVVGKKQTLSR